MFSEDLIMKTWGKKVALFIGENGKQLTLIFEQQEKGHFWTKEVLLRITYVHDLKSFGG